MRKADLLVKLAVVVLCGAVLVLPGDRLWGADDLFLVAGGSPWKRNGTNIYYTGGNVGIGTNSPAFPLHISSSATFPFYASGNNAAQVITGVSLAPTGVGCGVYGQTNSSEANAFGVYGFASGAGAGVYGKNDNGAGYGVKGENTYAGGKGVWGDGNGCGVYGTTTNTYGGIGIFGACSGTNYAIRGDSASASGYAGYFVGNFAAINGTKTAIVPTSQGDRKLYCQESPEVWFEDVGEGQLSWGTAHIDLDPLFLETVTIDEAHPMKVFIQLNDDCKGVYVVRQAAGFQVTELQGGTSAAHFSYRVMAKRKGYENDRLAAAPEIPKPVALQAPAQ